MAAVNDVIIKLEVVTTDNSSDDQLHSTQNVSTSSSWISSNDSSSDLPPNGMPPVSAHKRSKNVTKEQTAKDKHKDEPLGKEDLLLASTLVLDAKGGRTLEYILQSKYVRSYNLYNQWYLRWLLYLCIIFDLALAIFEKPAIEHLSIPYWGTMLMELVCLGFFSFRLFHAFHFQYAKVFLKDAKNIMVMAVIILTLIDMVCYIVWINVSPNPNPVRWSRPLRPLFIVNFPDGKQIRRAFRNIRRTIPDIANILFLFLLSVLLFGLLAFKLFYKRNLRYPNGDSYFTNYLDSVWDLYVLVTTANFPDVMMPAYDESPWFAIFFVVYLILCLYIFMSIVLATIYNNYKKNLKNEIKASVFLKRKRLAKAFDILKVQRGNEEIITHSRWKQLMNMILPNKSSAYTDLLMMILDNDSKNVLDKKSFLNLSDLLNVKLSEVKDRQTFLAKHIPHIYNHRFSEHVKRAVRHKYFRYIFDVPIVANVVTIAVDLDDADWFFLSVFTIEILCKFYVFGGKEFFQHFWNIFDLLVIGAAFIASVVEKAMDNGDEELSTLDILLVLRVMRLIKLFGSIKRFKVILQTLINIGPSIIIYGGVMFVFYYFFAIIGMEAFSGYIRYYDYDTDTIGSKSNLFCGNKELNDTQFYKDHYCNNNFNNIASAMVVMFELTVVNQWHVIASGFVHVTSKAARLYFYAFHVCCVVIVLNIFTAFILEAFILEYTLQTVPKLESVIETKIKELGLGIGMKTKSQYIQGPSGDTIELVEDEVVPDTEENMKESKDGDHETRDSDTDSLPDLSKEKGLKFHLKKQSRKKVEVLLQQMFQGEIGDIEDGPVDLDELDNMQQSRKLTLEEVT